MNSRDLPVYQQRERILNALESHRVVVVESPTGSGKTTQLPVILHEAGYSDKGVIGVTQPRRIAAVSVSSFVARQLGGEIPGLVGYKMRFYDKTTPETRIKVMTDGILLQEIKNDQNLQDYSIIIVDEAHERNLNIDFVLGSSQTRHGTTGRPPSDRFVGDDQRRHLQSILRFVSSRTYRDADVPGADHLRRPEGHLYFNNGRRMKRQERADVLTGGRSENSPMTPGSTASSRS